ncbi:hypothetical protein AC1031_000131 [Aphanomyces cochlioides]|nr:hypothetical protein AC1031_000131 [Aphanomyces cochlioides]
MTADDDGNHIKAKEYSERPMGNKRAKLERTQLNLLEKNTQCAEDLVAILKQKAEQHETHLKHKERMQAKKMQIAEELREPGEPKLACQIHKAKSTNHYLLWLLK